MNTEENNNISEISENTGEGTESENAPCSSEKNINLSGTDTASPLSENGGITAGEKESEEQLKEALIRERVNGKIEAELREIAKFDSGIKTADDLAKSAEYGRIIELVKRGNTLLDAYRLANFEKIVNSAARAASRAAVSRINSKSHLVKADVRGEGADAVPSDILSEYRMLVPDADESEIRRHYNKYVSAR